MRIALCISQERRRAAHRNWANHGRLQRINTLEVGGVPADAQKKSMRNGTGNPVHTYFKGPGGPNSLRRVPWRGVVRSATQLTREIVAAAPVGLPHSLTRRSKARIRRARPTKIRPFQARPGSPAMER